MRKLRLKKFKHHAQGNIFNQEQRQEETVAIWGFSHIHKRLLTLPLLPHRFSRLRCNVLYSCIEYIYIDIKI